MLYHSRRQLFANAALGSLTGGLVAVDRINLIARFRIERIKYGVSGIAATGEAGASLLAAFFKRTVHKLAGTPWPTTSAT